MKRIRPIPSLDLVRENLSYDAETGIFRYRAHRQRTRINAIAGSLLPNGYISIPFKNTSILAHRLAWYVYYGIWPNGDIDHINRNSTDNRIINLRECSRSENRANSYRNSVKLYSHLPKGVAFYKSRSHKSDPYAARIMVRGVQIHLGFFHTVEDAERRYLQAAAKYFGKFAGRG